MERVDERRRHHRDMFTCPTSILDKRGRTLLRGRSVDVSPCGIRIVGQGGAAMHEGQEVWVELNIPSFRASGVRHRVVKMGGEIRRVNVMGEWQSVVVVIFEVDFKRDMLDPSL